ncbi:MAG: hypothetical protein ACRESY_10465 [Steroidobacteraceae bacterium]
MVFALLFAAGWTFRSYGRFSDQLSGVAGMTLGDTQGEVKYKLGIPPIVSGSSDPGDAGVRAYYTDPQKDPTHAMPQGVDIDHFHTWSYDNGSLTGPHLDLTFDPATSRVSRIVCIDNSDPATVYCGRLLGISIGDPEGRVSTVLGEPTRQYIDEKLGVKTMEYGDIGAAYLLAKQRVFGISVVGSGAHRQPPTDRFLNWYLNELRAALRP